VSGLQTVQLGTGRLRVGPWRGDHRTAYVVPLPEGGPPQSARVRRFLGELRAGGYEAALTAALSPAEQGPFLEAGFTEHERLHLLAHDLLTIPEAPAATLRRARRSDRPRILDADAAAFPPFWRLDGDALDDAEAATPQSRFRVGLDGERSVAGYAIAGRAGTRGYLQRLAVHPHAQGAGMGSALVVDGLRWLRRRGACEVLVNTQEGNDRAVELYEHLGFRRRAVGLAVLRRDLAT
jgi:ribosomal protein S18 acetylase RimI-like enzyme